MTTKKDTTDTPLATTLPPPNPMELLRMAVQENADPDRLEKIMVLQERWERNQAAAVYSSAVAGFQSECPQIKRDREGGEGNFRFRYASYDDVMKVVSPIIAKYGIAVSFPKMENDGTGTLAVTCRLRCGIHSEDHTFTVPVPAQMRVNDTQKTGAAQSYAKRYAVCASLNIVVTDEDTDAQNLTEPVTPAQYATLNTKLAESGADRAKFLKWAGVKELEDFPACKFAEGTRLLDAKIAAKGGA